MAEIKWIKITTDIFSDEKILKLEEYPEADSMICLWLNLLCRSKLKNSQGMKEFKIANMVLTDDVLNTVFRYKGRNIGEALKILEDNGFIERRKKTIIVIPFWQDRHDRNSSRYKHWRMSVFERDGYVCQGCGTKKNLQAHHIITWEDSKDNTDLRYATENGITLCRSCHLEAHGGRWKK